MRRPGAHKAAGANVSDAAEKAAAAAGAVEHRMGPARQSELGGARGRPAIAVTRRR